jgi:TolB-like protein/Tfp pilus assembly protein PilF
MALYEGETLKQRLEKGRLGVKEALEVLRQVALGLEAAHRAGIVHRDIKPANVLITNTGTVKILDFGVAKLVSDSQAQTMTQAGHAMGTMLYMSPEQLRGESVDARNDLWSLGVLAYEVLAGVSPFQTDSSAATVARILHEEPPSLAAIPGIPDWLAQLVSELLRKNPAERPQTASEVLRRLGGGEPARSFPVQRSPLAEGTSTPAGVQQKEAGWNGWFAELKRRRVFRALVGYGIASFAVLQIIEPIMHGAHWPEIVLSYVVAGLAAGFPIIITLAWVFDVKGGHIQRTAPAAAATGLKGVPLALLLIAIGVLAAAPGLLYYFVLRGGVRSFSTEGSSASNASIAVLPFTSLSSGQENAYLAQGFHDELLQQLGRVNALRVISRTSVMQYKEGARNLREIARELDVSSIVEGSVQRAGNRVRVEARLIDAHNDRQIWGDHYDRDVSDLFGIQTAVAEEIAAALNARLSPAQKAEIEHKPTENAEAYDLYLRGLEYATRLGSYPDNLAIAEGLYRQAIQLDPSFALARAQLARTKILRYSTLTGTPDTVVEEARAEAQEALRLQPDLAQAHLALGAYFNWKGDRERALQEYELARKGAPAEALAAIAGIRALQGKFDESIRLQSEVVRLDPRSPMAFWVLGARRLWLRSYDEADRALSRALTIAPDFTAATILRAVVYEAKGQPELAKRFLREARGRLDPQGRVGLNIWIYNLLIDNPEEALAFLDTVASDTIISFTSLPKVYLYALAHEALGDLGQARTEYEVARVAFESILEKNRGRTYPPDVGYLRLHLGRTYAGLGRKEDALREARRVTEMVPYSKDTWWGCQFGIHSARIEARVGETDAALEHISALLAVPCLLSPGLLRIDPNFSALRTDPRFRKLAELEP